MGKYVDITLNQKIGNQADTLTYQSGDFDVQIGQLVEIPLRKGKTRGIITKIHDQKPAFPTKEILAIMENAPHLTEAQSTLAKFISEYYFCPLYKTLRLFMPPGFFKKKTIKSPTAPKSTNGSNLKPHTLSDDQKSALETIRNAKQQTILLHGITGSGKTEVYRQLAIEQVQKGNQVLLLIPEISLTPQTVKYFEHEFGSNIAIIHSKLTPAQKEKHWQHIHSNQVKIVIGSRSAIFAPFQNLGLIMIDEEHEDSYKQDQSPRYDIHKVANKMAETLNIKVVLGSATPSVKTYFEAKQGNLGLAEMNKRVGQKEHQMPDIQIVDMREEMKKRNYSIFSDQLLHELQQTIKKGEQAILFLNRRGAASAVICRDCGHVEKCPHCNIAYTYHQKAHVEHTILPSKRLICHHCGKIAPIPEKCPNCESSHIRYIGLGTQRIEEETQKLFPDARILRADRDTTSTRDSFDNIYHTFKNHEADILIGTQMIGKGLHLPKVTLVGVMIADTTLTIPDFRSGEKTFQLLTQVAGRSGRESPGKVVIQTYLPDHYAIQATKHHNYLSFYNSEIRTRQDLKFPPFQNLAKITVLDADAEKAHLTAMAIVEKLKANADDETQINTYPALISRLKNKYRWQILLTGPNPRAVIEKMQATSPLNANCRIDIDPLSTT